MVMSDVKRKEKRRKMREELAIDSDIHHFSFGFYVETVKNTNKSRLDGIASVFSEQARSRETIDISDRMQITGAIVQSTADEDLEMLAGNRS